MDKKVKLESYTMRATIPTGQYANLQPEITVSAETLHEAETEVLPYLKVLFQRFGSTTIEDKATPKLIITGKSNLKQVKSFTESKEEILFDPIKHIYYHKGNKLKSASGIQTEYVPGFNREAISGKCASAWGVEQDTIKDLWSSGGQISAGFGIAIHNALEHYIKFQEIGDIIHHASASKTENAALPKHPLLKKIVLDFIEIDKYKGLSLPEILISAVNKGVCGTVDKLLIVNAEEKICRIQDYKIIAGIEDKADKLKKPFDHLPATKLSQYQIQLSVYANIMQLSGWSVQGLDIFAYGEHGWEHYELEVLEIIN